MTATDSNLDLPAGANLSAVVHPDPDGQPTISVFENAFDAPGKGKARAVVRHTAVAPAIDVSVGDVEVVSGLEPGDEGGAIIDPKGAAARGGRWPPQARRRIHQR